jgi:hypothetical protein
MQGAANLCCSIAIPEKDVVLRVEIYWRSSKYVDENMSCILNATGFSLSQAKSGFALNLL